MISKREDLDALFQEIYELQQKFKVYDNSVLNFTSVGGWLKFYSSNWLVKKPKIQYQLSTTLPSEKAQVLFQNNQIRWGQAGVSLRKILEKKKPKKLLQRELAPIGSNRLKAQCINRTSLFAKSGIFQKLQNGVDFTRLLTCFATPRGEASVIIMGSLRDVSEFYFKLKIIILSDAQSIFREFDDVNLRTWVEKHYQFGVTDEQQATRVLCDYDITNREVIRTERIIDYIALIKLHRPSDKVLYPLLSFVNWAGIDCRIIADYMAAAGAVVAERGQVIKKVTMVYTDDFTKIKCQTTENPLEKNQVNILFSGEKPTQIDVTANQYTGSLQASVKGENELKANLEERQYEIGQILQRQDIVSDLLITRQKKEGNQVAIRVEDINKLAGSSDINYSAEQNKINGNILEEEIEKSSIQVRNDAIKLNIQTNRLDINGAGYVIKNSIAPEIKQSITIYNKENKNQINVQQNTFNIAKQEAFVLGETYAPKQTSMIIHAISELIGTVVDKKIKQEELVSPRVNDFTLGFNKKEQTIKIQEHNEVVYIEKKNQANLILEQKNKTQRETNVEQVFEHQIVCNNENLKKQVEDAKRAQIAKLDILRVKVREIQNNRLPVSYQYGNKGDKDAFDALMMLFRELLGTEYCRQYLNEYEKAFDEKHSSTIVKQKRPEFLGAVKEIFYWVYGVITEEICKIQQVKINSADELPSITKHTITTLELLKNLAPAKVGELNLIVHKDAIPTTVEEQAKKRIKLQSKIDKTQDEKEKVKQEEEDIKKQQEKLTTDINILTKRIEEVNNRVANTSIAATERAFNLKDEMKAHKEDSENQKRINEQKIKTVEKKILNVDKLMSSFCNTLKTIQKKQEEKEKPLVITISDDDKNYLAFKGKQEKIIQPLLDEVNNAAKAIATRPKPKYSWLSQQNKGKEVLNMVRALQRLRTALNRQFGRKSSSENERMYKRKYIENVMGFVDEYTETAQGKKVTQEQRVFQKIRTRLADVFKEYSKTFPMAELGLEVLNIEFQPDIDCSYHILSKTDEKKNVFLDLLPAEWQTKIEQTPTQEEVTKQSLLTKLLPSKLVTLPGETFAKVSDVSLATREKAGVSMRVTNFDIPEGLKYRRYKPYLTANDHLPVTHFFRLAYNIKERYMSFGNQTDTTKTVIDYITNNAIFPMDQVPAENRVLLTTLLARKNIKSQLSKQVQETLQKIASGEQGVLYGNMVTTGMQLEPILYVIETNVNKKVPVVQHELRNTNPIFKIHLATTPNKFVLSFGRILQKMQELATFFTKANYVPEQYKNDKIWSGIFKNDFDKTFEAAIKFSAFGDAQGGFLTKTFSTIPFYVAVNPMAVGYTDLPILEEGKWLLVSEETNKRAVDMMYGEGTFEKLKERFGSMTLWILTDMASKGAFDKVFAQKNLFVPDNMHITGKTYLFLSNSGNNVEDDVYWEEVVYLIVTDSYLSQTYVKKRPTTREGDDWVRATNDKLKFVGTNSPESYCCYLNERDLAYGVTLGYADSTNYAAWILPDDMRMFFKEQQDGYIYDQYGMRRTVKKLIENDGYYISVDNDDTVPGTAGWNGINVPAGYPRTIPIKFGWYCADFMNEEWFK